MPHTPARKDKYEGTREYWVDVETTGSFENENEESFLESTAVSGQGEDIELGLTPAAHADGEDSGASNDEDDDDDDDQASSVRTKNKGMGPEAESALEDWCASFIIYMGKVAACGVFIQADSPRVPPLCLLSFRQLTILAP